MTTVRQVRTARNFADAESHYNDRERELLKLDAGWAKCALALRTDLRFGHGTGQILLQSLPRVWEQLEARRRRLERGDTMEMLHAIALCAQENVPLPTWLATAYRATFEPFLKPGAPRSLDSIFFSSNLPTSTNKKAATARQDWQLGGQLYFAVLEVANKHTAIDGALDEVLSKRKWGIKKSKARKLVLMIEAAQRDLGGGSPEKLSRFWEKRRKEMRHK
jgi:hypothetical protein